MLRLTMSVYLVPCLTDTSVSIPSTNFRIPPILAKDFCLPSLICYVSPQLLVVLVSWASSSIQVRHSFPSLINLRLAFFSTSPTIFHFGCQVPGLHYRCQPEVSSSISLLPFVIVPSEFRIPCSTTYTSLTLSVSTITPKLRN
jgi:hypothetical protein